MVGSFAACCARAASGRAITAFAKSVMKSRLRICPPEYVARIPKAYHFATGRELETAHKRP
jgi:hypothetical protein